MTDCDGPHCRQIGERLGGYRSRQPHRVNLVRPKSPLANLITTVEEVIACRSSSIALPIGPITIYREITCRVQVLQLLRYKPILVIGGGS